MGSPTSLFVKNATIFTEEETITNGSILIKDGKIDTILQENEQLKSYPNRLKVIDGTYLHVIPGFIDGHIHGANGADVMDATESALDTMAAVLPKEGTTSFLATTITQSPENIERALQNIATYQNKQGQAEMIGAHLEGPFIEASKKGAQPLEYIMEPSIEQFKKWQNLSDNKIKTITMAPDLDEDGSFIRYLYDSGVNVSAGHTDTNFAGMKKAIAQGVRQVTHLCNAMPGIHHRDIGVVGAAFQLQELRGELIADGIHVSPEMLQLIYKNMGSERLILITDAMRAKCLQAGDYELGGQPVAVTSDRAVLEDGTLAGSILKMQQGARQMLRLADVSIENVIEMASVNPAKQLGIFAEKGSIALHKDADVLLVDDDLNIKYTICRGVVTFEEE
ncbi:N-acetylglucosamine-6-phosphate deacetylase [Virgibacillus sp. NKC19-16]|uniref:N-acetylglucosamine-6-phosphate deacetylase n=1 Tax=Virgibacillus salidurans TaxID=2831673 RepID=UPI001F25E239|nr:N-acetylglucosamine-6-phosphate deacetylase [Virgibacillus sp. NKC19-16]UJL45355.1 N-acetylglucosamine-6-phosphate deacetylase [Virgibacillus sp. NKC19-16]